MQPGTGLRVIGAAFEDAAVATRVLEELRRRFELGPRDAEIAPLGTSDQRLYVTLLAGRFPQATLNEVRRIIDERGGRIVVDLEEWLTRPIILPPRPASTSSGATRRGPGDHSYVRS